MNISIWKGDTTPPTEYHLWEKNDVLYVYSDGQWKELASSDYQNQIKDLQIETTGQIGDDYEQSYQLKLRGVQQGDTIKIPKAKPDASKQNVLVSGNNIKTINGQSILGSGNLSIVGTEGATPDTEMSETSNNTVENRVIKAYVDNSKVTKTSQLVNDSGFLTTHQDISGKQDKLTEEQLNTLNLDHTKYLTASNLVDYATNDYVNTNRVVIIIDNICGGSSYTLSTAVTALLNKQKQDVIKYIQHGTIISYTKENGLMESKQYIGTSDGSDLDQWHTYGGDRQVTLTQEEYDTLVANNTIDEDTYYNILED